MSSPTSHQPALEPDTASVKDAVPHGAASSESAQADRSLVVIGAVSGACVALSRLASPGSVEGSSWVLVVVSAAIAAQGGAAALWVTRGALRWLVSWAASRAVRDAYARDDTATYAVFLLTLATAAGVQLVAPVVAVLLAGFVGAQIWTIQRVRTATRTRVQPLTAMLTALLAVSGMSLAACTLAWQRMFVGRLGTAAASEVFVVASVLFGLGIGVLLGGRIRNSTSARLAHIAAGGAFAHSAVAAASVPLLALSSGARWASPQFATGLTLGSLFAVSAAAVGVVIPVVVMCLGQRRRSIGSAWTAAIAASAAGAATGAVATAGALFAFTGLRGTVWIAAGLAAAAASAAMLVTRLSRPADSALP